MIVFIFVEDFLRMETRLDELRRRRRDLDERARMVSCELRALLRVQRAKKERAGSAWQLSERLVRVALIIYVLAGYATEPAVVFLRNAVSARNWPEMSDDQFVRLVEQLFLDADENDIAAFSDEANPLDSDAMRVALRYVREWRLVAWGKRLNEERGVAPSVRMLVDKAHELGVTCSNGVFPKPIGCAVGSAARVWARRFRSRWNARVGVLKVQEKITIAEMQAKVSVHARLFFQCMVIVCRVRCVGWACGGFPELLRACARGRRVRVPQTFCKCPLCPFQRVRGRRQCILAICWGRTGTIDLIFFVLICLKLVGKNNNFQRWNLGQVLCPESGRTFWHINLQRLSAT